MKKFSLSAIGLVLIGIFSVGCSSKQERYTKVVAEALPKTVTIYASYAAGTATGAGVYVSQYGHILTCAHLFTVTESSPIAVTVENYDGTTVAGQLLYMREDKDLALVKTSQENVPSVRLADTRDLKVGQEVFAIGAPLGNTFSVSVGVISALHRDSFLYNALQTDTAINPGNSGGPLFNLDGELVGINAFIESPVNSLPIFTGLGFSIESGQLLEFMSEFRGLPNGKQFNLPPYKRDMVKQDKKIEALKKALRKRVKQDRLPFLKGK